jgi:hypothetical protein
LLIRTADVAAVIVCRARIVVHVADVNSVLRPGDVVTGENLH